MEPENSPTNMDQTDLKQDNFAAIDLGSNSFHMLLAEPEGDSIRVIDSLRVPVRLGSGLDKQKHIKPATEDLALQAIGQFAQRLHGVPRQNMRIVGTNTLRRARNAEHFINEAFVILRKRIEIIAGREEARLIYSAVSHGLPAPERQRMVIDIGGGSTELIIGKDYSPEIMESMNMGCVSYSNDHLCDEKVTASAVKDCIVQAQLELQPVLKAYRDAGWEEVIGCSGTIKAVSNALLELELSDGQITLAGLKKLQKNMISAGSVQKLGLNTISKNRSQVFAAGSAILYAIMKSMNIEALQASQVALREGLIFELIGKTEHVDIQSQTIANLENRYHVDEVQAHRVAVLSSQLFELASKAWVLDEEPDRQLLPQLLHWGSRLHEVGLAVAHSQYHKHGAYLIEHSDLLGFSRAEQTALSLLVRYHRRKLDITAFTNLPEAEGELLLKLLLLLRMSVLLQRARYEQSLDSVHFKFEKKQLTVTAPASWFDAHPLTTADLQDEAKQIASSGVKLTISVLGAAD